jgi:hypothetical protein
MVLSLLHQDDDPLEGKSAPHPPVRRKRRWIKWLAIDLLILLVAITIGIVVAARHAEPFLRALIVERLTERFHAHVELDSFRVSITDGLWAEGKGLRIWPPAQVEGMAVAARSTVPLISLDDFRFHAPLHYTRGKPVRIDRIVLRGLNVDVPPRPHFTHAPEPPPTMLPQQPPDSSLIRFQVGSVICTGAKLTLEPGNPAKLPLIFDIQTIKLTHITDQGVMDFDAVLTNPRPKGLIASQGTLGPWMVDDPGTTPVAGAYRFEHADLSIFRGIAGMLNSTGKYSGILRELIVDGHTDTPDFSLDKFGTPQPLHTDFHARVDGTNGDTWLEPVNAILGSSHFMARGRVVQVTAKESSDGPLHRVGHEIVLDVHIDGGEMGDFLRLTSRNGDPLLTGNLDLRTSLELQPGPAPVHQRLRLKGRFLLQDAHFTSSKVQDRIGKLSLRSQGRAKEAKTDSTPDVRSTMTSDFVMSAGKIRLPDLVYIIPGAEIDLHGDYGVDQGALNFRGTARMNATVSQMVGGWKGTLLKPVDRFFKKDGAGTKVGVHIEGSRDDPHFGIDL